MATEGAATVALSPFDAAKELVAGRGPPLRVLMIAVIIEFAGFGMLIPILPFFLMHELGLGPAQVGILLSTFSFAQLVGAWVGGRISDATGRYPVVVAVFAWAGVGLALTSLVTSFWEIFLVRVAQGLSGGTAALCDAYVLDVVSEENRATYVGVLGAVKGIAFILGPAIAFTLTSIGVARRLIFLLAGIGAFASATICFFFLQESLPQSERRPLRQSCVDEGKASCENAEFDAVNKGLACVWWCRFTSAMGLGFLYATYAFLIKDNFGWGDAQFAMVLLASGVFTAVMTFALFPRLAAAFGASRVLCFGAIVGVLAYALMPEPVVVVHLVALLLFQISGTCIEPSLPVLIGEFVSSQYLGFANGGTTSFRALATVLTPLIAGRLYEIDSRHAYYSGAACFALAAVGAFPIFCCQSDEQLPLLADQGKSASKVAV